MHGEEILFCKGDIDLNIVTRDFLVINKYYIEIYGQSLVLFTTGTFSWFIMVI